MEALGSLLSGFAVILTPANLGLMFVGIVLGVLIGVLPGIGTVATIAMLLPITFTLDPISALIMLAGIYYGSQYGGSTASILLNTPGEPGAMMTAVEGNAMARNGRGAPALATASAAAAPTQSAANTTGRSSSTARRSATGCSENSGLGVPLGRPRCEARITVAPCSSA